MKRKFNKQIQRKLNKLFLNDEFHAYTLGEFLKIALLNIVVLSMIVIIGFCI